MRHGRNRGQVLIIGVVLLTVVLALVGAFVSYTGAVRKATNVFSARSIAREAAQAGVEKAIWCLNQSVGTNCGGTFGYSYTGESNVALGNSAFYTTSILTISGNLKTVTATGYFPSVSNPTSTVVLKADISIDTDEASFYYGVQSGQGGFIIGNVANIQGNVYSNGNVLGSNGAFVTGDVIVAGGTSLSPVEQNTTYDSDYEFGRVSPTLDIAQSFKISQSNVLNKISLYIRKQSNPSDVTVRILADNNGVPSKTVIGTTTLSATLVTGSYGWIDASFTTPPALVGNQTYWLSVDTAANSTKYWQIASQTNNGYGNGVGMVSASWNATTPVWTDAGRDFDFKIWTGGNSTRMDNLHVYGNAKAHIITNSIVDKDAYYQTISGTTVTGASHPGSTDPGPKDLPISDAQIAQWRADGAAGGTTTGDVLLDGASSTIGPRKITGNLTVINGGSLTLGGTVYVQGNVTLNNNGVLSLASGYGFNSGVLVVDGKIDIQNNVHFNGSGSPGSYILVLSTNSSVDPTSPAINLANNGDLAIFYAQNGMINVSNNAIIREVTAFTLNMTNGTSVIYESGLADVNFTSGPGASWVFRPGTLREIH